MAQHVLIALSAGLLCVSACSSRLVVTTPNVTKPVTLSVKSCAAAGSSDFTAHQAKSFFYSFVSGSASAPPVPSDIDMAFLKADARDEKSAHITQVKAGSYGWFFVIMGGGSHWLEVDAETCAKADKK